MDPVSVAGRPGVSQCSVWDVGLPQRDEVRRRRSSRGRWGAADDSHGAPVLRGPETTGLVSQGLDPLWVPGAPLAVNDLTLVTLSGILDRARGLVKKN